MPAPRPRASIRPRNERPRSAGHGGIALALAAATAAVFLPAVFCGFVNMDDDHYVFRNRLVLDGLSPSGILRAWTDVVFHNWAPLTVLSLQLDTSLFGPAPWGYHLTNVLLHAATAAVVWLALVRMTGAAGRSAVATLLFALHPLRVESVAWVSERKDVLSVFFLAVALVAYDHYRRRPGPVRYLAVAAAMLASLLAKATAVTLPALLLVLDAWPLRRGTVPGFGPVADEPASPPPGGVHPWWRLVAEKLPLFGLSAAFVVITIATQQQAIQSEAAMPLWRARVPNAVISVAAYLQETVAPIGLHPAHQHPGVAGISWPALLEAVVTIAIAVAVAVRLRRTVPACAAGLAWFFIALLPVLGILKQQGFQARADRFTYIPHIGLMVAIVWTAAHLLHEWRASRRLRTTLAVAAITGCVLLDWRQIAIWRDSVSLWNHVLAHEPTSALAHLCLGEELFDRGSLQPAIEAFRQSLAIEKTARAHTWLGLALAQQGQLAAAYAEHSAAIRLDPGNWEAHNNAGIALASGGDVAAALKHFERAAELQPNDPQVRQNLAQARAIVGTVPAP